MIAAGNTNMHFCGTEMTGIKAYKTTDKLIISKTCISNSSVFRTEKLDIVEINSDIFDVLKKVGDRLDSDCKTNIDLSAVSNNTHICILNLTKVQQYICDLFNKGTNDSFEEYIVKHLKSHEFINFLFSGCVVQQTKVNVLKLDYRDVLCVSQDKRVVPNKDIVRILPLRWHKHPNYTDKCRKNFCVDYKMTKESTKHPKSGIQRENKLLKNRPIKKVLLPLLQGFRTTAAQQSSQTVFYVTAMKSLRNRMASFKNCPSSVPASKLARAGFFRNDAHRLLVKCYSCELSLDIKQLNDEDPMSLHSRLSPNCNVVRHSAHRSTDNADSPVRVEIDGHLQNHVDSISKDRPADICEDGSVTTQSDFLNGNTTDNPSGEYSSVTAHGFSRIDGEIDSSNVTQSYASCKEAHNNYLISDVVTHREHNQSFCYAHQPASQSNIRNQPASQPNAQNQPTTRPNAQNLPTTRPKTQNQPTTLPNTQNLPTTLPSTQNRPTTQPNTQSQPTTRPNTQSHPAYQPNTQNQSTTQPNTQSQPTTRPNAQNQPTTWANTQNRPTETRRIRVHTPDHASETSRRNSFHNWPANSFSNTDLLVLAGFYFTGTEDIVRCFHCDIGLADWNDEEDPWIEHARHSPECPYLIEKKGHHYIDIVQRQWAEIYNPKHNHLTELRSRLNTFANWPQDQVTQTPGQLADAGFFYTGESDTVRCHYCDGGLREWDPDDNPWTEHARWFPFCKFVLRVKGIHFIQNAARGYIEDDDHQQTANNNLPPSFVNAAQDVYEPSYEENCHKKGLKNPLYTTAAQSVMFLDYSKPAVTKAINIYIADTGRRDFKGTDLLNILFKLEEKYDKEFLLCYKDKAQPNNSLVNARAKDDEDDDDVEEFELTPEALYKEHERLTFLFMCINCKQRERQMLNVPCGHRLTCETCSKDEEYCSQCNVKITKKVKTYFG